MKTDREILAARVWAIPAICGLLDLHGDFKDGRFAKVTRLVWALTSVDVHLLYGTVGVSGPNNDALKAIFTLHKDGIVGVGPAPGVSVEGRQQILRFLAGEASREALRWSVDLVEWIDGVLEDDTKSVVFSLVSAMVAHPFVATDVVVEKCVSVAEPVRKLRLLNESLCTDITPAGMFGVNVYQAGYLSTDSVRIRYLQPDMRPAATKKRSGPVRFLEKARDTVLYLMLLPVATVIYFCEKKQHADTRLAGQFVEYLPNFPATDRADAGMSALSN